MEELTGRLHCHSNSGDEEHAHKQQLHVYSHAASFFFRSLVPPSFSTTSSSNPIPCHLPLYPVQHRLIRSLYNVVSSDVDSIQQHIYRRYRTRLSLSLYIYIQYRSNPLSLSLSLSLWPCSSIFGQQDPFFPLSSLSLS